MELNLHDQIQEELQDMIVPEVNRIPGMKQIDVEAWEFGFESIDKTSWRKFILVIYPILLEYDHRSEIWYRCRVRGLNENDVDMICKYFQDRVFPFLPWKPFTDEDAKRGFFSHKKDWRGEHEIAFFINPSYPKGAWQNHVIEDA